MASNADSSHDLSDFTPESVRVLQDKLLTATASIGTLRGFGSAKKKKRKKRGPTPVVASNHMYLLPEGSTLPHVSKRPVEDDVMVHQNAGFGFPQSYLNNRKPRPVKMNINASNEEHKQHMIELWPKLRGKQFQMHRLDLSRKCQPLVPNHPSALKSNGHTYRGTIIVKIVDDYGTTEMDTDDNTTASTIPIQPTHPTGLQAPSTPTVATSVQPTHPTGLQAPSTPTVATSVQPTHPTGLQAPSTPTVATSVQPTHPTGLQAPSTPTLATSAQPTPLQPLPRVSTPARADFELPPLQSSEASHEISSDEGSYTLAWDGEATPADTTDFIQLGRPRNNSTTTRQRIVTVQNREYFESLQLDRKKDMERRSAQLRQVQERSRRRKERERKRDERVMLRIRRLTQLGDEPEDGFVIIFHYGEQEMRRKFLPSAPQEALYWFVESQSDVLDPRIRLGTQTIQRTKAILESVGINSQCRMHVEENFEVLTDSADENDECVDDDQSAKEDESDCRPKTTLTDHESCRVQTMLFLSQAKKKLRVSRDNILQGVMDYYILNPDVVHYRLEVEFTNEEQAVDLDGLTKEMFTLFFKELVAKECEGCMEKIPKMDPYRLSTGFWTTVGSIISHAYVLYGMFPIDLCFASLCGVITGQVTERALLRSFLNSLSEGDREAIQKGRDSNLFPSVKNRLVHVFSHCGGTKPPTLANVEEQTEAVASLKLLWQPLFPLLQLKRGLTDHGVLWLNWHEDALWELYGSLSPDSQKVYDAIEVEYSEAIDLRVLEEMTVNHLERFLLSLSKDEVRQLLIYWTSMPYVIPNQKLSLNFNSAEGLAIRPTAMTCSATLTLSRNFMSYNEFSSNMHDYILAGHALVFDAI